MTVVTFEDYQPLVRYDDDPWTKVKIYESLNQAGPWTLIETITFLDPDVDSSDPKVRSFTTQVATLDEGWYKLIFEDFDGDQSPTDPVHNIASEAAAYLPLVSDIGDLLRARTKNHLGVELGTFTNDTRPTYEAVAKIIQQAADDVTMLVDYDLPVETYRQAAGVIALRAAMLVELSYFPEQVAANKSAYEQYKEMFDGMMDNLLIAVQREAAEEVGSETPMYGNMPAYGFPSAEGLWNKVF